MASAKEIIIKVIPSQIANAFVKMYHYSGKVVNNSTLHFGAFLDGKLHGVMSFGNPLDKSKVLPLIEGTGWNEMIELNRMAFDPALPKNSESRSIAIAIKLIRKNAEHIKWILSYADATQCGDGAIYRASGFLLTMIKPNSDIFKLPDGRIIHSFNFKAASGSEKKKMMKMGYTNMITFLNEVYPGWIKLKGYQLRYIFLIDPALKLKMKCSIIPFKEIDQIGAGMYKGKNISLQNRKPIHAPVA